jgi:hypothetical protein
MLREGMKNEECHVLECLDGYINLPVHLLDKYPLAIRRIIRVIWEHLEFYLNYFSGHGNKGDDAEMVIQAVAELEALESELIRMNNRINIKVEDFL